MNKLISSFAILFAISCGAVAAPVLLTNGTGQVIGATGIFIQNGSFSGTFDVSFEDGSCESLFSGCDSSSDFAGSPPEVTITNALQNVLGSILDTPDLIRGCESVSECNIFTPTFLAGGVTPTGTLLIVNEGPNNEQAFSGFVGMTQSGDLTLVPDETFAVWSPTPVPVPAGIWFLGCGLAALAKFRWFRK